MHLVALSPNPNNLTLTLNAGCPSNYLPVWPAGCLREVFLHAALIVDQVALGWRQREGERAESMYCRVQHRGRCPCQPRALLAARPDPTRPRCPAPARAAETGRPGPQWATPEDAAAFAAMTELATDELPERHPEQYHWLRYRRVAVPCCMLCTVDKLARQLEGQGVPWSRRPLIKGQYRPLATLLTSFLLPPPPPLPLPLPLP